MIKKACLLSVIFVSFLLASIPANAQESSLIVSEITGKVLVKIYPSTDWIDAKAGQVIKQKDAIRTDLDGKALLEFSDKSSITLKPRTEITVSELVWDNNTRKADINMTSGELKTVLNKVSTPSDFKVRTPTAICGARGTVFYVVVFADGTGVYVEQGLVEFLNTLSGQSYTVYEGMNSNASGDGSITEPQTLTKEEVDKLIADYNMTPVAEPYTEPGGEGGDNLIPPDVIQENPASGR